MTLHTILVNGCLVEMYIGDGDYKAAEEYSKGKNIGAMLRVFPNGQLMINDFAKTRNYRNNRKRIFRLL